MYESTSQASPRSDASCDSGDDVGLDRRLQGRARAAAWLARRPQAEWGRRYPAIGQAWRRSWEYVVPFFAFPPAIRKMIYTTNAVESLYRSLRKVIKTRGSFPTDEAAIKLLYLAIQNAGVRWRRAVAWTEAMGQFAIVFTDPGNQDTGQPNKKN